MRSFVYQFEISLCPFISERIRSSPPACVECATDMCHLSGPRVDCGTVREVDNVSTTTSQRRGRAVRETCLLWKAVELWAQDGRVAFVRAA